MTNAWFALPLIAALSACAVGEGPGESSRWLSVVSPVRSDSDRLLDYYARLKQLKPQDLGREYESVRKRYEEQQSDFRRIQLAMLLSLPGASFRDDAAALVLLQAWTKDKRNEASALRPMVVMLQTYLQELRRTDDAMQVQAGKLRDEQRRAEALQQKLEALLEMEMKMIEREQAAQPRKR